MCLHSIQANSNGRPIVFIDLQSYKEYIALPDHIVKLFEVGKVGYAHFADIIRTSLLYNYGGCWIDSTILLTKQLDERIFDAAFYSIKLPYDSFFVSRARWSNFFLACKPGNEIMGYTLNLFYRYLRKREYFVDYFMMDYFIDMVIKNDAALKGQIDDIPANNEHVHTLLSHLNDEYTTEHFEAICGDTYIHKLTWKNGIDTTSPGTIYAYFYNLYK